MHFILVILCCTVVSHVAKLSGMANAGDLIFLESSGVMHNH